MITYRSKLKSFGNKTCTSVGFSTTKLTGTALGLMAGLHIMNVAVNCLFSEQPVCFICKWKENTYSTFFKCSEQKLTLLHELQCTETETV